MEKHNDNAHYKECAERLKRARRPGVKRATDVFTNDLDAGAPQAVVEAPNDGGVALISLPCAVSLLESRPACPRVVLGF